MMYNIIVMLCPDRLSFLISCHIVCSSIDFSEPVLKLLCILAFWQLELNLTSS